MADSDANRANRLQVIRRKHRRNDVLETGSRGRGDIFSRVRRPPGDGIGRPSDCRAAASASDAELALDEIVDRARVGLAARRLHHLTHEPTRNRRLGLGLRDLVGVLGNDVVDDRFDRLEVGHLRHTS